MNQTTYVSLFDLIDEACIDYCKFLHESNNETPYQHPNMTLDLYSTFPSYEELFPVYMESLFKGKTLTHLNGNVITFDDALEALLAKNAGLMPTLNFYLPVVVSSNI